MTSKKYILNAIFDILRENPERMFIARELAPLVSQRVNKPISKICVAMHLQLIKEKINVVGIRKPGYFLNTYGWRT